ncbi:NADP-dependent malic enzyme [Hyphomonas sp.]|jgi:malate dehydrogenase (oxaloacetate-decarboxylating)(NADP+)|uniref:NADP-dependent malic enzyme n=2 Tax=Hyphomonas sp. TaxID=87 RepID=UPI003002C950|tara:strand:+ start:943 stop:3219 length:2277 start_codon:yes stop_codon:yes gene_type:complete|eukprot:TRINITY_DN33892_c0_g1_i1.p1 TRINITY_DN33892_c0_g1~~TRINITY_DN33892_c0_g1_i1.p1  ORF type:complete len:759 (+),score=183.95 TRINITY_DN33892_c0_g1_i1:71-2347(+)
MTTKRPSFTDQEALDFHSQPHAGKISMVPTKPMGTQRDLSLAYSPGVAIPVLAIAEDEDKAYDYTSKGNMVAVISNGTAILGLGNLGPMASKPVMEGKAVLFKRFADIDSFDVEVSTTDVEEFITTVRNIGATWGGINLEDISSPDCFIIESRLREDLDIPVFHDDQHGTAIIAAAGLINACHITGRELKDLKVAVSGAGAAGLSCAGLIRHLGVKPENILMCDSSGVVYEGRTEKMDQFKSAFAVKTTKRTLAEAIEGADVLLGLSAKGVVSKEMVKSMADNPIIFAMANPDPEITPEDIKSVRDDAIIATGRSDYPNQVNNVLGFPYIFRGALDVRARGINEEMKVAAARAIAELAREDVPDEVAAAYHGARPSFGREYIIPTPFDPRLISFIPPFVAQAAMDTGVARKPIDDMEAYRHSLARRADPSASFIQGVQARCKELQRRIVFAEGEEPAVVRAAFSFKNQGLGHPILIGREAQVQRAMEQMGIAPGTLEILNARLSDNNPVYTDMLYARLQRDGYLKRDAQRLVNQDRNVFGCCMLKNGDADGMVTGVTRNYDVALNDSLLVLDPIPGQAVIGMSMVINRGRTVFIADTSVTELPQGEDLANIAIEAARAVRSLGFSPRVAFLSYSTFGNPMGERGEKVREAVALLDDMENVDFEYEGDMSADVALNTSHKILYPFSRLTGPANVLVMPAIHAASISTKLLESMSRATVIGPMLLGLEKPVQIASLGATVGDIVNLATIAAFDVDHVHGG